LCEAHPELNPVTVRFTDLHNWVVDLPQFDDDHTRGGEKVLEAIQMAWMDEAR
jgi:FeS assembly protein IscX